MPELPPPGVAQNASEHTFQALTPETVAAVLIDFRAWLTELAASESEELRVRSEEAKTTSSLFTPHSSFLTAVGIDLHTLLGQFLAVRQEVNLQTRAVRAQQEQSAEVLRQLTTALDALHESQIRSEEVKQQAIDEAVRTLLKTLIDLYDALALAGREVQRLRETVSEKREQPETVCEGASPRFFSRFFKRKKEREQQQEREREWERERQRVRQLLSSLVTGYTMSLQRIERALERHGLEAVPAAGERFDPEFMEVVEAVADSGRPSGEVVEEVRRGYLWNGRVFRYAQVRVAK